MADMDDRREYDEPVPLYKPCPHGNDPDECEEPTCLLEWHHENPDE